MKFIIKLFPEITIKSGPVRKRMSRQLTTNMRIILKRFDATARVGQQWDQLEVSVEGEDESRVKAVTGLLASIPGVAKFARVRAVSFTDMHDIYLATKEVWGDALEGKTFCVRVKRNGTHDFTSTDVERYVGGGLNQHCSTGGVNLTKPDVQINLEIRFDTLYVIEDWYRGLGGFPIGSQESVVSLISGGFDSTVASYLSIKRGLKTHFLFFNLGGKDHELGVKEIAFYLWNRFGSSHRVKFITVPFDGVVSDILEKVHPSCMGVILKRMMVRAAGAIAERAGAEALVTGEAVAQVSSQTLTNLAIIDRASDCLVLRPLAMMDKGAIIDQCRAIGAEDFAAAIPEYCGVISVRPSAHLKEYKVIGEEGKMSADVLQQALQRTTVQTIDSVMEDVHSGAPRAEVVGEPGSDEVVIDIRHPGEVEQRPLLLEATPVLQVPFYSLNARFAGLDQNRTYLLYCEKGVMSQLHAAHLRDEGYANVRVYRP